MHILRIAFSLALPMFAQSGKILLTPENVLEVSALSTQRPGSLNWLPDSKRVVCTMAGWIQVMDLDSGKREKLTRGGSPKPSPDGAMIAFLGSEGGRRTIAVYAFQGATVRKLAEVPPGSEGYDFGFNWSRDSSKVVYGFRPPTPPAPKNKSSAVVIGGEGDLPPNSEVWVADVRTGETGKVTSGPYVVTFPGSIAGNEVIFSSVRGFEYRNTNMYGKIIAASYPSGETRTIVENGGVLRLAPAVSPDGTQIAFRYDPNNVYYPYYDNIGVVSAKGGPVRQLTRDVFVHSPPVWAPDGRSLYFACKEGVYTQLCSVTTAGQVRKLIAGPYNVGGFSPSPDGKTLLFLTDDASGATELHRANADGSGDRVLEDFTPPEIRRFRLGKVTELNWKSSDGLVSHGLMFLPPDYQPGRKYPLLVSLHGGPVGGLPLRGEILSTTPLEFHLWAARGFVLFAPDYRTGEVSGWEPVLKAREEQNFNDRDMDDIMSGVDRLIQQGIADPDRMALLGHSNGSYLTNWLITHTRRFKVAVSYEGFSDHRLVYGIGSRLGGNPFSEWMLKGTPWDVPENYRRNSPIEFVKGVTTPTLFVANDKGGVIGKVENLAHHELLYTALKRQGVDTQLVIYRGEPHVLQRPENMRDLLFRVVEWIDGHMPAAK